MNRFINCFFSGQKLVNLTVSTILLLCITISGYAQENEDEDVNFLPRTGDWAVGIDATPFFQYAGNLFNQNGNDYVPAITFNAQYPNSIFVKFKTGSFTTVRSILIVGMTHKEDAIINIQDEGDPHQLINSALSLGGIFGIERTKSLRKRLVSYYGFQMGLIKRPFNNGTTLGEIEYIDKNDEELYFKEYGGNSFNFRLSPFLGLEFYLFPRFAVSGEVSLNFNRTVQKKRYRIRGTADAAIIDGRIVNFDLNPSTSGNLGIFLYF